MSAFDPKRTSRGALHIFTGYGLKRLTPVVRAAAIVFDARSYAPSRLVKETTMLHRICLLSVLLLSTVSASAQLSTWQSEKQRMTPQGAPSSGGYPVGGVYGPSQPS